VDEIGDKNVLANEIAALRSRIEELESLAKKADERDTAVRLHEALLKATLDSAADGILAVDESGHVIFSNKEFARMWHIPPDLIEAADDHELLQYVLSQLKDPDGFQAKVKELYKSFQESLDILQFWDGRVFERFSLPLVIDENLAGRVWTFRDITFRK
jgi:two-component system sensor histidine kinase/response regulator